MPEIDGTGTLLYSRRRLLSEAERYDLGWFVACLCTPLLGEDLSEDLPRYRPDSRLARETNGDLAPRLADWREEAAETDTGPGDPREERRALVRRVSRHLVRTGFTLVMPRWNGWTSDFAKQARVFGGYYPERAAQMRAAAGTAYEPTGDPAVLRSCLDDLGPWLAEEYARVRACTA